MNTMTDETKNRVTDTLKNFIQATGDCDQATLHKTACSMFADAFPGRPNLARVAAEFYNSTKSIHKISTATDADRPENFPLLDPEQVYRDVMKPSQQSFLLKAASDLNFEPELKIEVAPDAFLQKVASEESPVHRTEPAYADEQEAKQDYAKAVDGLTGSLLKVAAALFDVNESQHTLAWAFTDELNRMGTPALRKRAADNLFTHYGPEIRPLLDMYNKRFGGMGKIAADCTGKGAVVENKMLGQIVDCWKEAGSRAEYFQSLHKQASAAAADCMLAIGERPLRKLAGLPETMEDTASSAMSKALGINDDAEQKLRDDMKTPRVRRQLGGLELQQSFMNIATDDHVSKFPLPTVTRAFNDVLQIVPPQVKENPGANLGLMKAMVAERLNRGSVPSSSDVERALTGVKSFGYTDPKSYGDAFSAKPKPME